MLNSKKENSNRIVLINIYQSGYGVVTESHTNSQVYSNLCK